MKEASYVRFTLRKKTFQRHSINIISFIYIKDGSFYYEI